MWNLKNSLCWLTMICLCFAVASCGGNDGSTSADGESARQKQMRLEQQLSSLQQQIATLDKEVADMRVEHEQHVNQILATSKAANNQLTQLKTEMAGGTPVASAASATAANFPPERSAWNVLLRVIIAIMLLGAIFFLIKYFYGRLRDEEDEELDDAFGDEEYRTDLGSVKVSPEAQAAMQEHSREQPLPPIVDPRRDD